MAYPTSVTSFTPLTPTTRQDDPGLEGDVVINRIQVDLQAAETKLGTGASTATSNTVLRGTGTGTTAFGTIQAADIAAGAAVKKIGEVLGTGASAVLEISSIPASYRSLQVVVVGRSDAAGAGGAVANLTFETSPTAGAYNHVVVIATTAVSSAENIGTQASIQVGAFPTAGSTASVYGSMTINIHEYANGSVFKPVEAVCNSPLTLASGSYQARLAVGTFESASAIDRVRLTLGAGNWSTASRMTIFGMPT